MAVNLEIVKELVEPEVGTVEAVVGGVISSPGDLSIDWRIEYEERAAIMQYDGGLSREEADKRAFKEILERIEGFGWDHE